MNTITSTPLRTLVAGAILSALAFSFATVSSADDGTAPPQVIVKFADLDVSTSQGAVDSLRPDPRRGRRRVLANVRHRTSVQVAQGRLLAKSNRRRGDQRSIARRCPLSSRPSTACHRRSCWPRRGLASPARQGAHGRAPLRTRAHHASVRLGPFLWRRACLSIE